MGPKPRLTPVELWAASELGELEAMADRVRAGIACKGEGCKGAGMIARPSPMGLYWVECGRCKGTGVDPDRLPKDSSD